MKIRYLLPALVLAALIVPAAALVTNAEESTETTTLETLAARVTALETALDNAEDKIADLEAEVAALKADDSDSSTVEDEDAEESDDAWTVPINERGGIAICHNGHSVLVNVRAALAHKAHGDALGMCGKAHKEKYQGGDDDEEDDEDEDEDEAEDEDDDADDE